MGSSYTGGHKGPQTSITDYGSRLSATAAVPVSDRGAATSPAVCAQGLL
jgi:hypothetical protein